MKNVRLETPDNVDELKALYKDNQLVYYTPLEEFFNVLTHALGAVTALALMVCMLVKAHSPETYATAALAPLLIAIEFAISAIYHAHTDLKKKLVWRKIDFPAVNLNVIACGCAICLLYGEVYGYVAIAISLAIAIAVFIICQWRFDIFRKVSVASTFTIGALLFVAFFTAYNGKTGISQTVSLLYLLGLISCLLGALLFGVHKRYVHCIFHVFVLIGPVLFLVATYLQIISLG